MGGTSQSDALPNSSYGICNGDSVQLMPSGGVSYQWLPNDWMTNAEMQTQNPIVSPTQSTVFEVEVTFDNNTTEINWFEINVEEVPTFDILASQTSGCTPMPISFSTAGLDNNYEYFWEMEDGIYEYTAPSFIHTYNNPGEYIPVLNVASSLGCIYTEELTTSILIEEHPEAEFNFSSQQLTTLHGDLEFEDQTNNAENYFWTTSTGLSSDELNPQFFIEAEREFELEVCLEVSSLLGCEQSICKNINYKPNLLLHMPQVFTPNNDGLNDTFGPVATGVKNTGYHLIIWNRWGEVVFETKNPDEQWNSLVKNSGRICPDGRYHWQLQAQAISLGEDLELAGSIFLIR